MSDPVPAISERDAAGETAILFADIREVLGVGVVNLIWRHLATIPQALPWAWATLRPLYVDGTVGAEAAALYGDLDLPRLPAFPPEALAAAGLHSKDLASIRDVLAAYERTNAMAFIALSALSHVASDKVAVADAGLNPGPALPRGSCPAIALPALLNLSDLSPEVAALVLTLNRLGTRSETPILASMYRHLAHWPSYLALAWALVASVDVDGRLERLIADCVARADMRVNRIARRLRLASVALPAPANGDAIYQALGPFTGDVIAKMVVICALLREASGRS